MEGKNTDPKKPVRPNFNFYWVYAGIGALLIAMILSGTSQSAGEFSLNELIVKAERGEFRKISHNGRVLEAWYTDAARDSIMKGRENGPLGGGFLQGSDVTLEFDPTDRNRDRIGDLDLFADVSVRTAQ